VAREVYSKPGVDGDPWACHADLLDADGRFTMTMGGFLLRTGERTILVDAGLGRIDNGRYGGGAFLGSLRYLGVAPADVTDVVFSHLHFDHVGWATQRGEIVFPNAAYRCHAADWAYFVDSPKALPAAFRKLSPLVDRLSLFDGECTLAPGVDALPVPGHTPGSTVYVLSGGGARALLLGDVVHSVVELLEGGWQAAFDVDRQAAAAVRERIARDLEVSGDLAAAPHISDMRFGRLLATGDGRRAWMTV
jgi:glyoxylase-like metal-dependent hydrolase (beta-lactamase superfamily II)